MGNDAVSVPMETKEHILKQLSPGRLDELAHKFDRVPTDTRKTNKALAKYIAAKRSLTLVAIVAELTTLELEKVCDSIELPRPEQTGLLAKCLVEALTNRTPREIRSERNRHPHDLVWFPMAEIKVIDGDTITAKLPGDAKARTFRLRGIDTPEITVYRANKKDGEDEHPPIQETRPLGIQAKERLEAHLQGPVVFAGLQPRVGCKGEYVAHAHYRLLAYITLDSKEGVDVGETLLREGLALAWTGNTKTHRYLHPRQEQYVRVCHASLHAKPGLWGRGLEAKCPCIIQERPPWSHEDCSRSCMFSE